MTLSILLWASIAAVVAAFFFGRAYESAGAPTGQPMPQLEGVDPWLASFREYRVAFREEALATVYARWRRDWGYHTAVAEYVARLGIYDPIYRPVPPGSAVSPKRIDATSGPWGRAIG